MFLQTQTLFKENVVSLIILCYNVNGINNYSNFVLNFLSVVTRFRLVLHLDNTFDQVLTPGMYLFF